MSTDLTEKLDNLKEEIRHRLSALLMDTDEEHPMEVSITLKDWTTITSIFQQPSEGIIWVRFYTCDNYMELDDLHIEEWLEILKYLEP